MLDLYNKQSKCLVALDSIIFGFDGEELKILLVKRGLEENKETWSLMGGWLQENEGLNEAADRILFEHTGLKDVYLEQLAAFGNPRRDPVMRTVSVTYKALLNIADYDHKLTNKISAKWFSLKKLPELLFDHSEMVALAVERLRANASLYPIGFELLPEKFTLPQLQNLYEAIFDTKFDKRNFTRKLLSTNILTKTDEKQKGFSKKGAFYFTLNKEKYKDTSSYNFLSLTNPDKIL
ncbi:NUDIX hydrolase [Lacihabitans soyangensis]|uniref:NUDIX domain-containing protein n=1 Tax=Lacihabitans soyangensis TaxID=869394 RepID=A0AAE3KTU7_9BACT|nr:NUDIX domain-containing protein [Lacihabitans soyangensis]MCP9762576.1 NUDIX domain-containing protein [Lacihabitans soyangensis]